VSCRSYYISGVLPKRTDLVGKSSVDRCASYAKAFGNCGGTKALFYTQASYECGID